MVFQSLLMTKHHSIITKGRGISHMETEAPGKQGEAMLQMPLQEDLYC